MLKYKVGTPARLGMLAHMSDSGTGRMYIAVAVLGSLEGVCVARCLFRVVRGSNFGGRPVISGRDEEVAGGDARDVVGNIMGYMQIEIGESLTGFSQEEAEGFQLLSDCYSRSVSFPRDNLRAKSSARSLSRTHGTAKE